MVSTSIKFSVKKFFLNFECNEQRPSSLQNWKRKHIIRSNLQMIFFNNKFLKREQKICVLLCGRGIKSAVERAAGVPGQARSLTHRQLSIILRFSLIRRRAGSSRSLSVSGPRGAT